MCPSAHQQARVNGRGEYTRNLLHRARSGISHQILKRTQHREKGLHRAQREEHSWSFELDPAVKARMSRCALGSACESHERRRWASCSPVEHWCKA
eukprot:CAMPEP_0171058524 /NCGR_PEP_ID=MMETSP0766_2-20121228/2546_1 /TAXON_ID=439317 /ORGANISM="Gambierdiscus australes, Strain CAWD 149" /LENGTH=95 /DNA_ID=CAMNT_0011513809 /DNA_START=1 /DNA_END=284 /DNA_ORIENTATION=-